MLSLILLAGVAYLTWNVLTYAGDWGGLLHYVVFLYACAPVCALTLAAMLWVQCKQGWPWLFAAGIFTLAAALQFALFAVWGFNQWTYCLLPVLLIGAATVGLARAGAPLPVRAWMLYGGPAFLVAAVLAISGGFGFRAMEARRNRARSEAYAAGEERKAATLKGIDRAAWLLELADWRSGLYREPRTGVEYRWDAARQRLVVKWPVLGEGSTWRPWLIKVPERALASRALRPGPRPALGGAILDCAPPLECFLTWDLDVEELTPQDNFRAKLQDQVTALEVAAMKEVIPVR